MTTTMATTTPFPCVPGWTEFFNTDSPKYGLGDEEKIANIVETYSVCSGGEISDIECKALIDGALVNYNNTGDFGVTCKISSGSYCVNIQQRSGLCNDYEIRLYCKCEAEIVIPELTTTGTPIPPIHEECGWTEWLNIDKPRSFRTDAGDIESIQKFQQYGLCQKPQLKHIECRNALTQQDWKLSQQNDLRCDTEVGFECYNRLQPYDCFDYEVRFYCLFNWCETTSTTSTTTSETPPTSPCLPGQYYDECAYRCNEICDDYLYKLHQVQKCQTGDDCIATCRPYNDCEHPFLWKDPYTCVEISKCGCVTPSGTIIEPGGVVTEKCTKCQCYDNKVDCIEEPSCPLSAAGLCPNGTDMKNFNIGDREITVSSKGRLSGKDRIHLNTVSSLNGTGGWSPAISDENQYVEVDFGYPRNVIGIVTQGENGMKNWVTKYSVAYSDDGKLWNYTTKVFHGNSDSDTPVENYLDDVIRTQYVRIIPVEWHNWIAMRLDLKGCLSESETMTPEIKGTPRVTPAPRDCTREMIFHHMPDIPRATIEVSSAESEYSGGDRIQIGNKAGPEGTGGWKAAFNDNNQFVLIDFQVVRNLSGILIQGQQGEDNWVTSFEVKYSIDGIDWENAIHPTTGRIFRGNNDSNTAVFQWFDGIIAARYIRIMPRDFHGAIAMRLEVLGCNETGIVQQTTTPLVPKAYCPELPDMLKENCPYCPLDQFCEENKCVDLEDCPCYVEGRRRKPGDSFVTSDCKQCSCFMNGKSFCEEIECGVCDEGYVPHLTSDCSCDCRPCENGTIYCPSDQKCIDTHKWCDGFEDCADDEVNCRTTVTATGSPPANYVLPTPEPCFATLDDASDVCQLNSVYLETFDGEYYKTDTCNHVLFRERNYQYYSVKIHKECFEESGYCRRYIIIDVDDFTIRIGPDSKKVLFNGVEVPKAKFGLLSKRYNEFILRSEGTFLTFISLKYGFKVIWKAHSNVEIKVSKCQLRKVDGLCGFYDQNKENDFQKPDGLLADKEKFINSWSTGPSDRCFTLVCDYHMRIAADQMCASIEDPVFKDCNDVLDMSRQKEICVASACECLANNYTMPDCTCEILESFVLNCEENTKEAVQSLWRVDFSCVPECPPGLVWQDCGPSCELTCDNFQVKNLECSERCIPGCFCPSGLVREKDKCIDAKLCHDCVCQGFGDPNYQTFDSVLYSFQGDCTYVLVHHQESHNSRNLKIYATNTECPEEPGTTCTTGLKIMYNNNEITVTRNQPVKFNGEILDDIIFNFYRDGVNITATKEHAVVYIEENNLIARYIAPNYGYRIELPSKLYYNETAGLCGVCNFNPADDFYHRDGYISESVTDFAYSWLVEGSREECTLVEVLPSSPNRTCEFKKNGCEIYVDPAPYLSACRNDLSYSHNVKHSLCSTVLQYASTCCEYGVNLDDWIKAMGCEIPCPVGMQFQCKSPCHLTCSNYKEQPSNCAIPPEYMCSCPGSQVQKNGECVDPIYCETCDDEGHKVGDTWNIDLCQSCECLPNLKTHCNSTECPPVPSCPEGTLLDVVDNGTCCEQYICSSKPTVCPPPAIPTCQEGAVPQLVTKYACPEYECICDISVCPPLRNISHLEPGEKVIIEQKGCCFYQEVVCDPEVCPSLPQCPAGSKKVETEGKCCNPAECVQEQCVYTHKVRNETLPNEEHSRLYNVGEIWKDGLCLTCTCHNESGLISSSCEDETCEEPFNKDYMYEAKFVPEECCPEYVISACQSNGTVYQVGEEWPTLHDDKCTSYKCALGENGDIEKITVVKSCDETCPANARYRKPAPEEPECCGYCEQFACEDDGKIYEVGEKWIPSTGRCITAECVKIGNQIEKQLTGKQCPLIPPTCPDEYKIKDESGCCDLCKIIPGVCEVRKIPRNRSVNYFFLTDEIKGACFNKEPLEDLAECSGNCRSETTYLSSLDLFKTVCNCCIPREYEERPITLHCEDGSSIVKQYREPKHCECRSCSNESMGKPAIVFPNLV